MKSTKVFISILISAVILFTGSCKKDKKTEEEVEETDKIKPTLTLKGPAEMDIIFGEAIEDPGASAVDNKDGALDGSISSNWKESVDLNKIGTYLVDYSVTDITGNRSSATRKVNVKLIASCYDGGYASYTVYSGGTTPVFSATVSSVFNSNQLVIYPFAGFDPTLIIDISGEFGDQLSFSQTNGNNTLTGTGSISENGETIILNYKIATNSSSQYNQQFLTRKKPD